MGYGHGIYIYIFSIAPIIIIKAVKEPKIKRVWGSHYITFGTLFILTKVYEMSVEITSGRYHLCVLNILPG